MSNRQRQVVMAINKRPDKSDASLRGGKGAYLMRMQSLGLPVPPGFTITTTVTRAVAEHGVYPKRFEHQLERELAALERATGKRLGDPSNPLLLSVRSGAEVSMPGMMDTVLNIGMTRQIRDTLANRKGMFGRLSGAVNGRTYADDCYKRLVSQMGSAFTSDPREQLLTAIKAVHASWDSERAVAYRKAHNIPDHLGTAVTVQAMVFGNRDEQSGTGVAFSRDPNTGKPGLYGEFLPQAQGEAIVSGSHTPMPIAALAEWNATLYNELVRHAALLENDLDTIAEIEFTIESGTLYLLQYRKAKLSADAAATFAVHRQWERRWDKSQAIASLTPDQLATLKKRSSFGTDAFTATVFGKGIAASPGAVNGRVATSSEEVLAMREQGVMKIVLLRRETSPHDFQGMLAADAIVTLTGGATSHAAVVARQLGKPAVVGANLDVPLNKWPKYVSVCGNTGTIYVGQLTVIEASRPKEVNIFLKWCRGFAPEPRINFAAAKEQASVPALLMDVYLLEAMAHAACGTGLEAETALYKQKMVVSVAERFACYLAIAVASELRHLYKGNGKAPHYLNAASERLSSEFGVTRDHERGDECILPVLEKLDRFGQAEFFSLAEMLFIKCEWGNAYGGEKWAHIAQAVRAFLTGEWSHGLFVDRVFDLRHNTGPVFDKHRMLIEGSLDIETLLHTKLVTRSINDLASEFRSISRAYHCWPEVWHVGSPQNELWYKGNELGLW